MITIENVLESETTDLIHIQQTICNELVRRCLDKKNNLETSEIFDYLNR